jgi:hypothetical protein
MDNTDDNYISLFNQSTVLVADNDTIKSNINNQLYINQVNNTLIKNTLPYILLATDISNSTIQTKLTNDYIIDATINQSKILNLVSDLTNITNLFSNYYTKNLTYSKTQVDNLLSNYVTIANFLTTLTSTLSNYYLKTESDNLYYNKTYIDTLIALYYTKVQIDNLIALYYTKTQSDNLYYNKLYIDSFFYNKTYIDNLITSYYTKTQSDNLYYNKTYIDNLIALYYTKTQSDNKYALITTLSNYVTNSSLTTTLSNYVLTTTLSNYVTNSSLSSTLSNYVLTTYLNANYYNISSVNSLLNNKLDTSTYNTDQTNLALKFFSPLSNGNLRKSYFEYADLTSTKYIFFSQNGSNQYQTINFINDGSLLASKLETTFYDKAVYCYDNFVDSSTGVLSLASLNTPGSVGTYYLKSVKSALLTINSWELTSALTPSFTLPYSIISSQSGYGSGDTCAFKIIQQTNRTTSTGAGFTVSHADNVSLYTAQFGYNSSGRFPTTSPSYIQYQNPYGYCYSTNDFYIFCKSTTNNNISVRLQCTSNPDRIYFWCITDFNNYSILNAGALTVTNLYPNSNNASFIKVNSDLQITGIIKCDTIQAYSATNVIYFNNQINLNNNVITNASNMSITNIFPNTTNQASIVIQGILECISTIKCDTLQAYSASNLITFNNDCTYTNKNLANMNNIFVSNINANTTNNTEIKFNNTLNVNNNLIKNYKLDNQTFDKTTSGGIYQKLTTANTYAEWGFSSISGAFSQFGMQEPTTQPSTTSTRITYLSLGNDFLIKNSSLTYTKYTFSTTQTTIDNFNAIVKIDNLVSSTSANPINMGAFKMIANIDMNNYTLLNYAISLTGSNSIPVNVGSLNFLKKTDTTGSSVKIYGMNTSSFLIENFNGECAGIGFNGGTGTGAGSSSDYVTIYSAGDNGSILSLADEDVTDSRVAYISNVGAYVVVSSKTRKHSIKEKNNNNVLERILKLNVKSYGYKYEFNNDDSEKKKQRMINKSKKQQLGLILEELYDIFPNACSFYDNELMNDLIDDQNIKNENVTFKNKPKIEDVDNISNMGINYNNILLYLIIAFQDYVKSNKNINNNDLIIKNNIYINDKLDEFDVRLKNTESNNLRPDEIYRIKNIINSQDSVYKCINDDINNVKLQNDILRDKQIDHFETNTLINNSLKDEIKELKNEIAILKDDNTKFKLALKMVMDKLNKKV